MADSYVKDAFLMPQNLIGLGAGVVVSMMVFPPLFLGVAALEGIFLWQVSSNPRFQRMIRSRRR
jgi:hypothetical protein